MGGTPDDQGASDGDDGHMTQPGSDPISTLDELVRRHRDSIATKVVLAAVPWLAYWVASVTVDQYIDFREISLGDVRRIMPWTIVMVFLPALAAVWAAPAGVVRHVTTVLLSGLAIFMGITVIAMDDGQAGFAIMWMPLLALPLAGLLAIGTAYLRDAARQVPYHAERIR